MLKTITDTAEAISEIDLCSRIAKEEGVNSAPMPHIEFNAAIKAYVVSRGWALMRRDSVVFGSYYEVFFNEEQQ